MDAPLILFVLLTTEVIDIGCKFNPRYTVSLTLGANLLRCQSMYILRKGEATGGKFTPGVKVREKMNDEKT